MAAKRIKVSSDDITYYTLPGNTGSISNESGEIDDTVFGQNFKSSESGLINWSVSAQAFYKGFVGYVADLHKASVPTVANGEAMTLVSGKTYRVTDSAKDIWDYADPPVVYDNAVDHTSDVESIDYLFGRVTFNSTYTVTGPVTVDITYFATLTQLAGYKSFTLTQTEEAIDTTTIPVAQGNSGHMTYTGDGLKTVALELSGLYASANGYRASLVAREIVIVKINPDGVGKSVARGYFKFGSQGQDGDVGALEEENVTLRLNVPDIQNMTRPFGWVHTASTINLGVKAALDAWEAGTLVYVQYLPDGVNGVQGQAAVTDISLSAGLETMNEFTVQLQGTGALAVEP
jgi:hypothetical protein